MDADDIRCIAVVGAGLMGHGIAQEFALAGYQVWLHSRTQKSLDTALGNITANLDRLIRLGVVSPPQAAAVPKRIRTSPHLETAVSQADVVVESVYEDADLKRRIFQELDAVCPDRTILASNTSTLMLSQFATATRRPDKLVISHYANPPYLIPIVELVRGATTSDETVETMRALLTRVGKRPVVVQKEVPGFILNRLQGALLREALWLVQEGIASPRDIDTALKNSIGRRWAVAGIFEVFELAGWDLLAAAMAGVYPHLSNASELPPVLTEQVQRGELGVKTGQGFYAWTPESAEALRHRIAHALVEIESWSDDT